MFCPICSNPLLDESTVCNICGHQLRENLPKAPAPDKKASKLITITFLLTLVLLAVSILLPLTTDIFEIPFVDMAMELTGTKRNIKEVKSELEVGLEEISDSLEDLKQDYEDREDELSSSEQKTVKKAIRSADKIVKQAEKVSDKTSLINFRSFVGSFRNVAEDLEDLGDDYAFGDGAMETFEQIEGIVNLVIIAVIGMFALPLIFTVLGGLLKSKGLTIAALVFIVLPQLAMCGVLWVILSLVLYIWQAVLCGKAKKAKLYA